MSSNPAMLGIISYGLAAARLGRASRAAVLAKRGASASTILRKTGYQRGVYGRGVETRGDAFLKPTATFGAKPAGTLAEVADVHPDVERAYPGVGRSLRVEVVPDNAWDERVAAARKALALWEANSTASAFYDRGNNLIAVRAQMPGESLSGYLDRADGSLVHELQHYAQHQDGLRPPRRHVDTYDYKVDGLEVEARNSAARRKLTPAERVEMPREMTQDVKPEDVRQDAGGGDNFGTFRNFLATDDVPESIFGIPVVQDESQYTEKDLAFFKENPKAAGFYDLGDEDVEEDVPQQAAGAGVPFLAMSIGPVGAATYRKNTGKDLGDLEKAQSMKKGWFESQKGFELRRKRETGWEFEGGKWKYETPYDPSLKYGVVETPRVGDVKKRLEDVLDFSRVPEYLLAYPDVKNVPVILAGRGKTESMKEDGLSGYYSTGKKTITIRTDRGYNNTTKAAIHEVGHPVYQMEHGVPTDLRTRNRSDHEYLHSDDEVESRILEARHDLTPEQRMNTRIADSADVPAEKRIGAPNKANQDAKGGRTRGKYPGASNNPGNVERHENRTNKTLFEGEDGGGARPKRFARFTDPVLGLKAAATVLARHADSLAKAGKPLTIENYAPIYAPKGENNTEEYIKNVSAYSGIARDATIDRWDTETLAKLLKAKVRFETGPEASQWFTDEEYKEAAEKLQEGAFD